MTFTVFKLTIQKVAEVVLDSARFVKEKKSFGEDEEGEIQEQEKDNGQQNEEGEIEEENEEGKIEEEKEEGEIENKDDSSELIVSYTAVMLLLLTLQESQDESWMTYKATDYYTAFPPLYLPCNVRL